ncbi:hypothetical protein RB195_018127 [Necator americanus]|uniref:ABC-2 type transporter n=1 Tax=Necator americanus TaxID=51031 RepID=A0ABR1C8A4_NECAM
MVVPAMVSRSYEVCQEKACGLEKLMEVMGAGQFDFYISHAMMSFLCGIFVLFPFEIVNALHLSHAYNFLFMGAACLLLGLSCTLVCLICSAITSSPLTSVITSIVVFLFLFILAVVTNSVESRSVCYYILTLNPFAAYKMFAGSVVNYHIRGAKPWVTFRTAYYDVSSPLEFLLWFLSSSMVMILLLMLKVLYSSTYSTTEGRKGATGDPVRGSGDGFYTEWVEEELPPDVVIRNVSKQWSSTRQNTVCDVCLTTSVGQCFMLLCFLDIADQEKQHSWKCLLELLPPLKVVFFVLNSAVFTALPRKGLRKYL